MTINKSTSVRTRIAPSPTGYPHIGTIYQALFNYAFAKQHNGSFAIRIEDTDQKRKVAGAEEVIYEALEYYRLTPDEGPKYGGDFGPYRQSERLDLYRKYADELVSKGHAYYCFCSPEYLAKTRKTMQKQGKPPMYDKSCREIDVAVAKKRATTETYVIRMKIPPNETITFTDLIRGDISIESNVVDDQVILKSDGFPTYHLALVVDDQLMEITHMVRGEEWISSTPKHVLLYRYFGWSSPKLIHLPLLRNPDRSKISKRHGHTSAFWYKDEGYLVETVNNFLASLVWNHPQGKELFSVEELTKLFKWEDLHIQGPIVDLKKLDWLNGQWIRQKSDQELMADLKPYQPKGLSDDLLVKVLPLIKERLEKLSQIEELTQYFYQDPSVESKLLTQQSKMDNRHTAAYLKKVSSTLGQLDIFEAEAMEAALRQLQQLENLKPRPAFMTIRVAVTGRTATPPLFDVMEILGQDEVLTRLNRTVDTLS